MLEHSTHSQKVRRWLLVLLGLLGSCQVVFFFLGSANLYDDLKLSEQTQSTNSTITTENNIQFDITVDRKPYIVTTLIFIANAGGLCLLFLAMTMIMSIETVGTSSDVANTGSTTNAAEAAILKEYKWIHFIQCCSVCRYMCYCLNTTLFLTLLIITWICAAGTVLVLSMVHHINVIDLFHINILVSSTAVYVIGLPPVGSIFCGITCYTFRSLAILSDRVTQHTNTQTFSDPLQAHLATNSTLVSPLTTANDYYQGSSDWNSNLVVIDMQKD